MKTTCRMGNWETVSFWDNWETGKLQPSRERRATEKVGTGKLKTWGTERGANQATNWEPGSPARGGFLCLVKRFLTLDMSLLVFSMVFAFCVYNHFMAHTVDGHALVGCVSQQFEGFINPSRCRILAISSSSTSRSNQGFVPTFEFIQSAFDISSQNRVGPGARHISSLGGSNHHLFGPY